MKHDEIIEMAMNSGLPSREAAQHQMWWLEAFTKLVAAKERSEMSKGYAGVTLWVGDARVTQIVSEELIDREIKRGMSLEYAANKCLAVYREARGDNQ